MKSLTLGGLLFDPQFAHLAHSPQWGVSPFLRQESEIAYGLCRSAYNLELFPRRRRGLKDARLAME